MDSEIFSRIRDYLAAQLEVEPEKITPDSDIVNDFGADSLDVIDMITTLSDEFGVEIPDEDLSLIHICYAGSPAEVRHRTGLFPGQDRVE